MKRSRPEFDDSHAHGFFVLLGLIPQFDLLILKTHAVIEHLLFSLLATRMRVDPEDIPAFLPFRHVAELTLAGIHETLFLRLLERFSALRNLVAHSAETAQSTNSLSNSSLRRRVGPESISNVSGTFSNFMIRGG